MLFRSGNFLIDEAGRIYEGRWAANYPSGVAHTGEDVHHRQVRGAHALGHNDRTIGIALLGTYTTRTPPPAMVNGLVDLLTWKCARWAIDPLGTSTYVDGDNHRQNVPNIIGHRDICPTICPGQGAHDLLPAVRSQVSARLDAGDQAYWVVSSSGRVVPGGAAQAQRLPAAPQYGAVATTRPHGRAGLWVLTPRGQVLALAGAVHHGDLVTHPRAHAPVRALVSSASGNGYWIVGTDGSVFGFGDAVPHGSLAGHKMSTPIVGAAAQPSGLGYWLLGQDGGVFCFGRAGYHGSAFPHGMSDRAVSIVETADGLGYWIVHRSGAVRSFGSAARVAWVRGPSAPLVEVRRNASGLIGLCADGNFVHTVGAAAYPSLQRALGGAVPVGFVMGG